ncbi:aspartate/glutamate racemase family protein [Pseudacidovorax intermedius]|uniref:Arylmalonate decarboxylase n=1 Tax=Pseudacidovorax intermedius TaxID=433924 RepID=A0A147H899_9BURK|nr:aspartate/glutamate racemase family protein [Pseudacidovorax intermedius]KTT25981.1 arylmalonate decarboxylase [Pseudacidovorax intermedius]
MTDSAPPVLGLIVPPAAGEVPPEGPALYAGRVRFMARGLALAGIHPEGFDAVEGRIVDLARELRDAGAQAISLMGTSLSFYRGAAFTEDLRARMAAATGLPCTTMSHAIVRSLRDLGVRRVAVATAYIDTLNDRLAAYLDGEGFEVTAIRGLAMTGVEAVGDVDAHTLAELAHGVVADGRPDGLLISCGGLRTLDLHPRLERELGLPVTSSSPAGFWDLLRTAGLDAASPGHGRLFDA